MTNKSKWYWIYKIFDKGFKYFDNHPYQARSSIKTAKTIGTAAILFCVITIIYL